MGPEPLIFPLAVLGLLVLVGALATVVLARSRWLRLGATCAALVCVSVATLDYSGARTAAQNAELLLFEFGFISFLAAPVLFFASLVLVLLKPQFVRIASKLFSRAESR